jgi:hemoglobin
MNQSDPSLFDRIGGQEGISVLLRHFYADVRQHNLIGPVFNARIRDWPVHLAKIGQFWARVTGGPSSYMGQMPAKHLDLGLAPEHFGAWLQLWDANCRCYLKPREAQEMSALAHEIGKRLQSILNSGSMFWGLGVRTRREEGAAPEVGP